MLGKLWFRGFVWSFIEGYGRMHTDFSHCCEVQHLRLRMQPFVGMIWIYKVIVSVHIMRAYTCKFVQPQASRWQRYGQLSTKTTKISALVLPSMQSAEQLSYTVCFLWLCLRLPGSLSRGVRTATNCHLRPHQSWWNTHTHKHTMTVTPGTQFPKLTWVLGRNEGHSFLSRQVSVVASFGI